MSLRRCDEPTARPSPKCRRKWLLPCKPRCSCSQHTWDTNLRREEEVVKVMLFWKLQRFLPPPLYILLSGERRVCSCWQRLFRGVKPASSEPITLQQGTRGAGVAGGARGPNDLSRPLLRAEAPRSLTVWRGVPGRAGGGLREASLRRSQEFVSPATSARVHQNRSLAEASREKPN